jgi:hypothetical protein
MDDQTAIATAAGVTFASVAGDRLAKGEFPSGRLFASTCLAFAGLGLVAMADADIGKGLAIAVAGTAFATMGLPLVLQYFPDDTLGLTKVKRGNLKASNKLPTILKPIGE